MTEVHPDFDQFASADPYFAPLLHTLFATPQRPKLSKRFLALLVTLTKTRSNATYVWIFHHIPNSFRRRIEGLMFRSNLLAALDDDERLRRLFVTISEKNEGRISSADLVLVKSYVSWRIVGVQRLAPRRRQMGRFQYARRASEAALHFCRFLYGKGKQLDSASRSDYHEWRMTKPCGVHGPPFVRWLWKSNTIKICFPPNEPCPTPRRAIAENARASIAHRIQSGIDISLELRIIAGLASAGFMLTQILELKLAAVKVEKLVHIENFGARYPLPVWLGKMMVQYLESTTLEDSPSRFLFFPLSSRDYATLQWTARQLRKHGFHVSRLRTTFLLSSMQTSTSMPLLVNALDLNPCTGLRWQQDAGGKLPNYIALRIAKSN